MNKRSFIIAVIIGVALGFLVIHPLWVSLHAFDGMHSENMSWLDFAATAYREAFAFEHLVHLFVSIFSGILLSVLVIMMRARNRHKKA